jgi:hypothetical protein
MSRYWDILNCPEIGTIFLKTFDEVCKNNLNRLMRKILFTLNTLIALTVHAQWNGPSSGNLSTANRVHLNYLSGNGTFPAPPTSYVFSVAIDNGSGTFVPSLRINDNNGNVEIGKLFHINNSAHLLMTRTNSTNVLEVRSTGKLILTTDGIVDQNRGLFINNGNFDFYSVTQQGIVFKDQTHDLFKVTPNGFAYARKMVVTLANPFPDYVFETNYKLMPLSDLATFIAKNKHLPNMPSAQQVADNNNQVELGEMQTKLLEKVEELTLYILQQQAQIDELKRILAEQQ